MKNISYNQAINLVNYDNALLIDVQLERDYLRNHLPGSINIPLQNIKGKIRGLTTDKNRSIVVYCQRGVRSTAAAYLLEESGYNNVYNIKGGIEV